MECRCHRCYHYGYDQLQVIAKLALTHEQTSAVVGMGSVITATSPTPARYMGLELAGGPTPLFSGEIEPTKSGKRDDYVDHLSSKLMNCIASLNTNLVHVERAIDLYLKCVHTS